MGAIVMLSAVDSEERKVQALYILVGGKSPKPPEKPYRFAYGVSIVEAVQKAKTETRKYKISKAKKSKIKTLKT